MIAGLPKGVAVFDTPVMLTFRFCGRFWFLRIDVSITGIMQRALTGMAQA